MGRQALLKNCIGPLDMEGHGLDIASWAAGLPDEDIVFVRFQKEGASSFCLPYFIAIDRSTCSVVLAIRGTLSFEDALTDLLCEPAGLDEWIREMPSQDGPPASFGSSPPPVQPAGEKSHACLTRSCSESGCHTRLRCTAQLAIGVNLSRKTCQVRLGPLLQVLEKCLLRPLLSGIVWGCVCVCVVGGGGGGVDLPVAQGHFAVEAKEECCRSQGGVPSQLQSGRPGSCYQQGPAKQGSVKQGNCSPCPSS